MSSRNSYAAGMPRTRRPSQPQTTRQPSVGRPQQSLSRRQSQAWLAPAESPVHSHYKTVQKDIQTMLYKPESNDVDSVTGNSRINLRNLLPYTRFMNPFPSQQLLACGRLILLSAKPGTTPMPKTLLLEPDAKLWSFLTPLRISVDNSGLPTDKTITCAGLGAILTACSEELLREGLFVFFECDKVLDQDRLRKNPSDVTYLRQAPRNTLVMTVGYSHDRSTNIRSHPESLRQKLEHDGSLPYGRKLKWGRTEVRSESPAAWTDADTFIDGKEVLVCFRGEKDPYGTNVKAQHVRAISEIKTGSKA